MSASRIVIVGATSAIAERCARLWALEAPAALVLLGRDRNRLQEIADDLKVRSPNTSVACHTIDFLSPEQISSWISATVADGVPDIVLIAHGSLPDQQACQRDLATAEQALALNGISPVLFAEGFAGFMQQANHGSIAIIGSVAGDRGRKSNYVYGAAKGMIERYVQGLQHRLASTRVRVTLIKPGPTDTPMTQHLADKGMKLASSDEVAARIVRGVNRGTPVVYAPSRWALIMVIIRHLPRLIFNRLDI